MLPMQKRQSHLHVQMFLPKVHFFLMLSPPTPSKKKKTYKCDICGVVKSKSNDLKDHKRSAHMVEKLKCQFCDKIYSYTKNLKAHVK